MVREYYAMLGNRNRVTSILINYPNSQLTFRSNHILIGTESINNYDPDNLVTVWIYQFPEENSLSNIKVNNEFLIPLFLWDGSSIRKRSEEEVQSDLNNLNSWKKSMGFPYKEKEIVYETNG